MSFNCTMKEIWPVCETRMPSPVPSSNWITSRLPGGILSFFMKASEKRKPRGRIGNGRPGAGGLPRRLEAVADRVFGHLVLVLPSRGFGACVATAWLRSSIDRQLSFCLFRDGPLKRQGI